MNIYFIRHGETHSNKDGLIQGLDDTLTEEGILQAKIMSKRLKNTKFDIIYTSPLVRALETTKIISDELRVDFKIFDLLSERRTPSKLAGLKSTDPFVLEINSIRRREHESDIDWTYDGEESFSEIKSRALKVLDFIAEQEIENILIVTHGGIMKFILSAMLFNNDFDYLLHKKISKAFLINNTGVSICKLISDNVSGQRQWKIVSWNDQSHLEKGRVLKLIN